MNPTIFGVIGPGFLNQVPKLNLKRNRFGRAGRLRRRGVGKTKKSPP